MSLWRQILRSLAGLAFLFAGCQSPDAGKGAGNADSDRRHRNINEVVQRRLPIRSVSKGWDGNEITWPTETYLYYTVMYYDGRKRRMPQWKILPNGYNVRGTGRTIAIKDKPARGVNREYRIEVHEKPLGTMKQAER